MNLVINPLKSICLKYKNKDVGINELNDTCYGICASFNKNNDLYEIDSNCSKICEDMVNRKKYDLEKQTPYKPIIWEQIPRYIPYLISKNMDKDKLLKECNKLCKNNLECKEYCELDFNAIEMLKPVEIFKPLENYNLKSTTEINNKDNKIQKKYYLLLYLIPFIIIIFLMIKKK